MSGKAFHQKRLQAMAVAVRMAEPGRLAEVARMADLSDVAIDEDGRADRDAIRAAIEKVLEERPEWRLKKPWDILLNGD